jgi:hypothetical protein
MKHGSGIKGRDDRSSGIEIRMADTVAKINPTDPLILGTQAARRNLNCSDSSSSSIRADVWIFFFTRAHFLLPSPLAHLSNFLFISKGIILPWKKTKIIHRLVLHCQNKACKHSLHTQTRHQKIYVGADVPLRVSSLTILRQRVDYTEDDRHITTVDPGSFDR